jgi:hypothetical protein
MRQIPGFEMAQPNVVREPSMDEILASIRRIIESNDPVPSSGIATSMAEPEGFSGRPANDDQQDEVTLTIDGAFSAPSDDETYPNHSQRVSSSISSAPLQSDAGRMTPAEPPKSLSLADVAARVRAAAERGASLRDSIISQPPAQPEAAAPEPVVANRPVPMDVPILTQPAPAEAMVTTPVAPPQPTPHVEAYTEAALQSVSRDTDDRQSLALVSETAGEQVARSFQDLAIALERTERRSLDEIAADLLRPMLQEWLDDNLPTLVERLVREEIERIARGARR